MIRLEAFIPQLIKKFDNSILDIKVSDVNTAPLFGKFQETTF